MLRSLFQQGQSAVSAMWSSKYYLPVLLVVSLFSGALTGLIASLLFRALAHTHLLES